MTDPKTSDDASLEALRQAAMEDPEVPALVRSFLSGGARLDALRLNAHGVWTYRGAKVEHPRVQALFSRSLHRTQAGTWVLRIPPYTYPVLVDGPSLFVHKLRGEPPTGQLGSEDWVPLDLATLETDGDTWIGLQIHGESARLVGHAYQSILDDIQEQDGAWSLHRNGTVYPIRLRETGES